MGYMARQPVALRQILFVDYINYMGYVMQADKSLIDTQTHRTRLTHKFKVTYYNTKKGGHTTSLKQLTIQRLAVSDTLEPLNHAEHNAHRD